MTIQMVNGFPVYAVTRKEVAYHPSYLYEYTKAATDVDVDQSQHFQDYRRFLDILEQLKA